MSGERITVNKALIDDASDKKVIQLIMNGDKNRDFSALMREEQNEENYAYIDDMRTELCDLLAKYTGKDKDQMMRIFHKSKMYPEDDSEALDFISKAIDSCDNVIAYSNNDELEYDENGNVDIDSVEENKKIILEVGDRGPKKSIENIIKILEEDKNLKGKIMYNTLAFCVCAVGSLPWDRNNVEREWTDTDDAYLRNYIEKYISITTAKINDAVDIVAHRNTFDPVKDYLESLKWDGIDRISTLLRDYLGAEGEDEYLSSVMLHWMKGAVARAYEPGAKVDEMLVLYGPQGSGKSTFFRKLAKKDEWYNDRFSSVVGKDACDNIRSVWIAELSEMLATTNRKDCDAVKAFVSSQADIYRPAYARRTETHKRHCVFAGTTNNPFVLKDETGNRRYLLVTIDPKKATESVFEMRSTFVDDLWAQAVAEYKASGYFGMPKSLGKLAETERKKYEEDDTRVGMIQDWLDNKPNKDVVCVPEIWKECLGNFEIPSRKESSEIHTIMRYKIYGWKPSNITASSRINFEQYGKQIAYQRVKEET